MTDVRDLTAEGLRRHILKLHEELVRANAEVERRLHGEKHNPNRFARDGMGYLARQEQGIAGDAEIIKEVQGKFASQQEEVNALPHWREKFADRPPITDELRSEIDKDPDGFRRYLTTDR